MENYTVKPTEFVGQFIKVNGKIMLWQDNAIMTGYTYFFGEIS